MRFQNVNNEYITKINQTGELFAYHPSTPLPAGYGAGWWSIKNKIANVITDRQGLSFDVTNLQAATGATAISDGTTATAAATGAGAVLVSAGEFTAIAGTAIASGDYETVAFGACGSALFSVLGYLSYQAQVQSNLTSNGFATQAVAVQTDISQVNLLIARNISNICIATGFTNCNVSKVQTISNLSSIGINYKGIELSNLFSNTSNYAAFTHQI